ncbi:MAG: hypothetical protein Q8O30_07335 [Candidatus Omnitrophota bacterium]|nr:hypothetical protein [Candidatus Omnitrophota bacterium]
MLKKISLYKSILIFSIFILNTPLFLSAQVSIKKMSIEERERFIAEMEQINPKFSQYHNRLGQILKEIDMALNDYKAGKLSKQAAVEKLKPLLKEQIEIMNDTDFLVSQRLFTLLSQK